MESNHRLDNLIRREISDRAHEIVLSEYGLQKVLAGISERQKSKSLYMRLKKYMAAVCIALAVVVSILVVSEDARAFASEMINNIKTVFVMDKDGNIVEKPASEVIINPAVVKNTELSDKVLSEKTGMKICFPQTIYEDFRLQSKVDAVAFNKKLSYEDFDLIRNIADKALDDKEAFRNLGDFKPYRSVGGIYRDSGGVTLNIAVMKTKIQISNQDDGVFEIINTKIGKKAAQWIWGSFADYNGGEMTQKPVGMKSVHALFWSANGVTYEISSYDDKALTMDETAKIADAFMKAQR